MGLKRLIVPVTVSVGGAATVYSKRFSGYVHKIVYAKENFADGVDFDITLEVTGEELWNEDNVNASAVQIPRALVQTTLGVDTAYYDLIAAGHDRVKIMIAAGGVSTSGKFHILVDE